MKVVINAYSARLGGGQTYLRNLLEHLPQRFNLEVEVFAPESLALPNLRNLKRAHTKWPTTNPLMRTLWEKFVLPIYLRRERADILFCPGGVVATQAPAGCKTVTMFRNMIPFDAKVAASIPLGLQRTRNWILRRVMLRSMANADLTIFISEHARKIVEALTTVKTAVTIPHGISKNFRTYGRTMTRPSIAPMGSYLLYVSRFDVYKHHSEVVEAFARLPLELRRNNPLLLVGEVNSHSAQVVKTQIQRLNLQSEVVMLGPIQHEQLASLYHHARVIIFASSCENCPNILLESMGAGRPVLSSNVMPMPEFGGADLAYFSPFDPEDIARVIRRVLTDAEYANTVARAALKRSKQYDTSASAAATWAKICGLTS